MTSPDSHTGTAATTRADGLTRATTPAHPTGVDPAGPPVDQDLVDFAVELATEAGRLATTYFFAGTAARRKADGTEVTGADLAVEEWVRSRIAGYAPDDAILGEEAGPTVGTSGRRWVIDPISGTAYFTRRMPLFANLIAFEDEYGPAIGVINMPVQRELVFAARGRGCWLRDDPTEGRRATTRRTGVGARTEPDGALTLGANQHAWPEELLVALHRRVALAGGIHHAVVHVVTGRADAAVLTHQSYDDLAPLPVILAEAGGRVSDIDGAPVLLGNGTALVANEVLHAELLRLLAGVPAPTGGKRLA